MFKIIITLLTFIPWIAYTITSTSRSIKKIRNQKLDEKLIHNLEPTLPLERLFDEIKISSKFIILFFKLFY